MEIDFQTDWSGENGLQMNGITPSGTQSAYGQTTYTRVAPGIFKFYSPANKTDIMALSVIDSHGKRFLIGVSVETSEQFYLSVRYASVIRENKVLRSVILKQDIGSREQTAQFMSVGLGQTALLDD